MSFDEIQTWLLCNVACRLEASSHIFAETIKAVHFKNRDLRNTVIQACHADHLCTTETSLAEYADVLQS